MAEPPIVYVIEVNFAIKKFAELPVEEKLAVYEALRAEVPDEAYVQAAVSILKLVTSAENYHQLTDYANECLGVRLDGYFVWTKLPERAYAIAAHFKEHLKLTDGVPVIDLLEVPRVDTEV